eukprot:365193-Chlamydomonas_euryale.AAC.11
MGGPRLPQRVGGVARFGEREARAGGSRGRERSDRHGRGVGDQARERWGTKGGAALLAREVGKAGPPRPSLPSWVGCAWPWCAAPESLSKSGCRSFGRGHLQAQAAPAIQPNQRQAREHACAGVERGAAQVGTAGSREGVAGAWRSPQGSMKGPVPGAKKKERRRAPERLFHFGNHPTPRFSCWLRPLPLKVHCRSPHQLLASTCREGVNVPAPLTGLSSTAHRQPWRRDSEAKPAHAKRAHRPVAFAEATQCVCTTVCTAVFTT